MFPKVATTAFIENFVQRQVDEWKAGRIHGRDLTSSICKVIEDDCDVRFAVTKIEITCNICGKTQRPGKPPATGIRCDECGAALSKEEKDAIISRLNK